MSHKYVSNKQTLHNTSFLSKLAGTLSGRVGALDESTDTMTSSLQWRSTKTVSKRIKTATGTIAVYEDTPEEEVARLQAEALEVAGGAAPPTAKPLDARAGKMPPPPPPPPPPAPPPALQQQQYVVVTNFTTSEGARVVTGQKMLLITTSSASKRVLLEDDSELQLLDNSAAKHKMAIRPKKTRPDSRTLAASASASKIQATHTEQEQQKDEEWLMQSVDGKDSIWLPKYVLEIDTSAPPPPPPPPPSQKRPAEDDEDGTPGPPSGDPLRLQMLQEIRDFKTKKKRSSSKLGATPEDEARAKRSATVRELIETEEELVRDLHFAVENYYQLMDQSSTPRHIRDQKELIFSNFNFFPDFHKNVLIEGIKYHAEVPRMIGKTFLRLERDFDQHAEYCSSEPLAQEFLENNSPVREYFEEHSQKIGDDKRIQEHLQLPIQRLNDYQLLIRELVKYGNVLGDDTEELSKALELMQTIPQRATDAKFIASIEGFRGNLYKLGRLVRHDWFSVKEAGHHRAHDRYLFLFKARILVTKVKRIAGDRSIFLLKNVIRLPETSLGSLDDPKKLEFSHIEAENHLNYPIVIEARTPEARDAWLEGVKEHVVETASVDDLLFDDEIRIVSEEGDEIDEGRVIASPVPEDYEDFPDDTNLEELPEQQGAPKGRIIPIVLEDDDQVVPDITKEQKKGRGKGDEESSPLPARKKAKADLLHIDEQLQLNQFVSEEVESRTFESVIHSSTTGVESETAITSTSRQSTTVVSGVDSSTSTAVSTTKAATIVGAQQAERQVENIVQAEPDVAETEFVSTRIFAETDFEFGSEAIETDSRLRQQKEEIQQEKAFALRVQQQNLEQQQEISRIEDERKRKENERLRADEERRVREEEEQIRLQEQSRRHNEEERVRFEEEQKREEEDERVRLEQEQKDEKEKVRLEQEQREEEERLEQQQREKEEERVRLEQEQREEAERVRLEQEQREEEERVKVQEEKKRKAEEERKVKEEEHRLKLEEERIRKEEEEKTKLEEDRKTKENEERLRIEVEKKLIEEKEKIKLEGDRKSKEEDERKIREENEKIKLEEETKIKNEEERIRIEEETKRKEEEKIKLEEVKKRKAEEEERIKYEAERKRRDEEERIRLEEERKTMEEKDRIKLEEERMRKEFEDKIRLEEQKKRKEEEEKIRFENEQKRRKEEEDEIIKIEREKIRQEEQEKIKLEEERKRKEEYERKVKEENERTKLEEERKVEEEKDRIRLQENKRKEEEARILFEKEKQRKEEEERIIMEERRKKNEEEDRIKLEDERKLIEEEMRIKVEEERKITAEKERARLEKDRKIKQQEEKIKLQEEKKRIEVEERERFENEQKRKKDEEIIKFEEERKRIRLEEEKKAKEEDERKLKEERERIKLEDELRIREEEERIKLQEEKNRKNEEERLRLEEEQKKKEEERRIKFEEERKRKEKDERIKLEVERKRKEEDTRIKLEEEKKIKEEKEKIRIENERKRKDEEKRIKLEEENKRKAEEEERIRLQNEQETKDEEERNKLEEERKRKDEEEKIKFEEKRNKIEEEKRIKLEDEKKIREENERIKLEEEGKRKNEEERLKKEEDVERKKEQTRQEEEERKRREEEKKIKLQEEQKRMLDEKKIKIAEEERRKEEEEKSKKEEMIRLEKEQKHMKEERIRLEEANKRITEEENKIKEEAIKKKMEDERHEMDQKRQAEEKIKLAELKKKEEIRKKKENEEKNKIEERLKELEDKKKKEAERKEDEERKMKQEEELKREEEEKLKLQREQKQREVEEQQKKEAEQIRLNEEKVRKEREQQKKILEEERKRQKELEIKKEQERQQKELERKQREEEENKKLEEERKKKEEDRKKRRDEENIKQKEEKKRLEEVKRKLEEEKIKKEEEKKKMDEEKRLKEECERKLADEKQKQKNLEKIKKEEERLEKLRVENEKRKKEEEKKRLEELERQKYEEEQLFKKEEERKKKEKDRKRLEEEQKRRDAERVERRRIEEENIRKEEEESRKIEEEFNHKKEEERKRRELERKRQEDERNRKEEERLEKKRREVEEEKKKEEAKRKKEEEKRLKEEEEKKLREEKAKKERDEKEKENKAIQEQQKLLEVRKQKEDEEKRKKEIEEWNRLELEMKTKEEERLRQKEEEKKKKEDERRKKEEERRAKEEERLDNIKKQEALRKKHELEREEEFKREVLEKKKRELEDQRRNEQELKKKEEEKLFEMKKQDEIKIQREQKVQEERLRKQREEAEQMERERAEMALKKEKEMSIKSSDTRLQDPKFSEVALETSTKKKRSIVVEPPTEDQKKAKMSEPQTPATPGGGPRPIFTKTLIGAVVELPMPRLIQRTSISRSPSSASTASCASVFAQEMKCIQILIQPGEAAVFVCNVTHPVPYFVTWLKDNKLMDDKLADRVQQTDDGAKHELKILNCRPEDTGIYTAKATDTEQASATCSAQLLVQELTEEERNAKIADKKPFFLVKLRDTTVIETTNLSYVVQAKGDPMPDVKFFKDGQPLKEDDRVQFQKDLKQGHYELLIRHVQKSDAGVYKCTAMNKFGDVDCQGKMSVLDVADLHTPGEGFGENLVRLDASHMPSHYKTFVVATKEQEALESLSGKGSLLAAGEKADFKWFRDGQEFDPLERFNVHYKDEEDTLALVFQNVTPEDAGLYTCVASTSCGKISCSAELTVEGAVKRLNKEPKAPVMAEPLSDAAVSAGSSAFLECKITGYPLPELTWTRNGLEVKVGGRIKQMWEDDDSVSLIIKNIKETDSGLYRVVAKNELGECESDCKLAIRAGPKIKRMRKEVACNVGNALDYNVEVEGEPLPEVKWLKDGKELLDSDRIKLVKESDTVFAFKITSMTLADCGTYTVIASNDIGQRSETFQVMCDSPPQITRGLDPETEKKLSNDHTFEVRATGSPTPSARWYKDNKEIMGDDKFRMVKDDAFYMLKIRRLDRKDKGVYKIVLTNATGEAESEGALVIRAPPEFLTPLKDACAKEGSKDIKLFVEFQGNPKPTVKWTFKDKPIRPETEGFSIKSTDTTSMLVISEALADFVGNYTVTLGNEYGDSVGKAKFRLHEAPVIVEGLKDVEFLEDNTAKIVIKATGVPVPEIKWTLDGKKYSPDERRIKLKKEGDEVFMIWTDEAKTEDSGLYQATITNCEGTVTTEANVIVNTPPHILSSNFKDGKKVVAMHKFVLEVEATAVPEAAATWFVNNQEIKEAEDVKLNFDGKKYTLERIGCDPEHSGEYTCKLKNKIKEEAVSGQVTIYEKESRVRNGLKDIYVKEFSTATLKCQIVGDPVPAVEWLRDGKPIPPSGRFEITEDRSTHWHTLVFKDVAEKDKSVFTVRGKNTHGECETLCNLGVLVKPQPGELNSDTVDYGKNVKLSVYIHAYPPPKMVWTLNGKELQDSEHTTYQRDEEAEIYSLYLTSAVLEDIGTYAFTASNEAGEATGDCKLHVHSVVPTVGLELKSQAICLEDEVTFTLRCCGLPLPVPQWTKKGVVQKGDPRTIISTIEADTHIITFKDICMEDYGKIEVVATSVVGKTSSSCDLTQMTLQCEVLEGLENVTKGAEGEDVTLSVLIRASPRPVVIWTKDGDQLVDSDKVKIFTEKVTYCDMRLSLTLVEATSLESGQYRVKFSNLVNEASTETALVVRPERKAPKIRGKPADAEVTEKGPAMFKCKIAGFPRPDVKWMKDGRQVRMTDVINMGMTADGQFFLEFRHCTSEDAGAYTVVAENEEGKTEATMNLIVNPPASRPEFLQGLRATKVIRGYPCRMEVKCGGFPKPTIAWLKDGQPLEVDGKHIKQIELEDGTVILQIDEATDADAGRYSCVARNADGDNTSSAPLGVLGLIREDGQPDGPATFTSGLKDTCADEGKTLILPVAVKGGPVPNMKWYKDGKEIKLDDRMFFTYDGDRSFLEIRPCRGADSGVYRCEVEGADGSKAATECTVTVRKCFEAPSFGQGFNSLQQLPGLDIRLSVRADGVPRPELTWFKDNKPIDMSDVRYKLRKDGQSTTLLIRDCTYSDSAIYKCVATNKEGSAEHEAAVEVADEIDPNRRAEAPVFLKVIGDQEVFENDSARFKAIVSGKPIPDFQWLKNGHPIIETNRVIPERDIDGIVRLTLRHVCEEDSGSYTLKVWNDYGKASCMGKLSCECISKKVRRPVGDEYQGWDKMKRSGIPIPLPDKPIISALSDRRATISWLPYIAQGPQPPVTYQVEMCESPEGEWFTARTGIRGTSVDITNLAPKCDYKFRIRNENKYGVSEPSPYVATFRSKLEVPPVSYEPKLNTNFESTGDGPYVPEGFTIDRDAVGNYYAPPRFLRLLHDTQYGQRSFNSCIKWYAFGYPTPKIRFTFNGMPLETGVKGSRITHTQEATGEIMLFIDKITEKDVGGYECHAKNEHGESKQKILFELAEYPRVTQHLEETHIRSHATGRIMCRIAGYPPCNVQWYKDWVPLKPSFRLRPQFIEPDMYILNFNGAIMRDCGLYSLSAVNVAGVASSSCMVQVEDDDDTFVWTGPGKGRHVQINRRRGQLEDHYDVGDELGRGTQGITYHCVEHFTGRNFAAKSMWGRDRFKVWMHLEHEMMNLSNSCRYITRLYDCYESAKNMVLVMELCAGGELLQTLTQHQYITEYEVAHYIRQILEGLEYLHDRCIAHLGLNIGDVMLTRPNGTDVKLGDLSLARTIRIAKLQPLDYGMPEYVAPEVALGKGVSYAADMWAVGVITYLLLSGTSPFRGDNDRETLSKVQKGELTFDVEAFANISPEAKDFMAKLLQFKPENRLEVKAALIHPWLVKSQLQPRDPYKINTDNLRTYAAKFREWYANASCRRWYRRRPLQSAFTHPSKMVYPPGEVYTPPDSPDREMGPLLPHGDYVIPHKDLSYELDPITSESHYQQGPDTYLLQLRDVDFPVRLRQYMKVAANRSPGYAAQVRENLYDYTSATPQSAEKTALLSAPAAIETVYSLRAKHDSSTYDYCCSPGEINLDRYIRIPVVHERRRFTDIMDEEIDDERRRTIVDRYSSGFVRQNATTCSLDLPRRVTNEVRSRSQSALVPVSSADDSTLAPFLREKPFTCSVGASKSVTLSVLATGKPAPIVQWFRNDIILAEGGRLQFSSDRVDDTTTRATMTLLESRENDVGAYKVVARNQHGQTLHRFRLVQACLPSICDCPEVGGASDSAVLLQWKPPMEDGGSHVLAYHLQIKAKGDLEWRTVDDAVDMERYVVTGLAPDYLYQFRLAARNSLGWGEFSIGTPAIRTGPSGCPKLVVPPGLAVEDHKSGMVAKQQKEIAIDYSKEDQPVTIKTGEGADLQVRKYKVVDELSRGRFSTVGRCVRSDDHRLFAVKILATANRDEQVRLELDLLRSLRHQRLALLHEAYQLQETTVLVQELLSGMDIVSYLSMRHAYSEQIIAVLLTQVLDGLSYLQWRGVSHLDLQPDNLVLSSTRFPSVKLVDFGSARKVEQTGTAVPVNGLTEYIAPEVLFDGKAYPNTDIWSLGVITYVLLSGVTPFRGDTEEDLKANIQCVRYRFEWLPTTTTQEANRFLMLIFKRDPSKRPTVSECLEHRWLNETDFMVRKRERASIISNRIRDYSQLYHGQRSKSVTTNKLLLNFAGLKQ